MNKVHYWLDEYSVAFFKGICDYMEWAQWRGRTTEESGLLVVAPFLLLAIVGSLIPWWADAIVFASCAIPCLYMVAKAVTMKL